MNVSEELLDAIRWVESRDNPKAVSDKGAKGAYQFLDATGQEWHAKLAMSDPYDPFNETQQRQIARAYLTWLGNKFLFLDVTIGAYNCGPGNMAACINRARFTEQDHTQWEQLGHLCSDTQEYISNVMAKLLELETTPTA